LCCGLPSDTTNVGIVLGTSDTAVSVTDYALGGLISHGVSSGNVVYANGINLSIPTTSGSSRSFSISRSFYNNSGGDISVEEVGIHAKGGTTPYYYLIERTLFPFTFVNNTSATLVYTFTVTAGSTPFQVAAIADMLYVQMTGNTNTSNSKNTAGTTTSPAPAAANFACTAALGTVTQGIVVGTGGGAVTVDNYALGTPVTHGTGSTQLQFSAVSFGSLTTSGSTRYFTVVRTLTGNSTTTVNVTEVGLYANGYLIDRTLNSFSVLASPATKVITYNVSVSV